MTWEVLPDGTRRSADSRFRKIDDQRYGFDVTRHDPALPLVIDPGLEWSTFLGGSGQDPIGGVRAATRRHGRRVRRHLVELAGLRVAGQQGAFPDTTTAPASSGSTPMAPRWVRDLHRRVAFPASLPRTGHERGGGGGLRR